MKIDVHLMVLRCSEGRVSQKGNQQQVKQEFYYLFDFSLPPSVPPSLPLY